MGKHSIILLTNIMTPYRKFFYDQLYEECQNQEIEFYVVLMAETESNRHWNYCNYQTKYTVLLPHKTIHVRGIELHVNKELKELYMKLNPSIVICAGGYIYPSVWTTIRLQKRFHYRLVMWSESHLQEERNYNSVTYKIRESLRKSVIGKFPYFWCAGKLSRLFVEKYARADAQYIFTPNLIDATKFCKVNDYSTERRASIKDKYGILSDKRVFLIPARLSKVKGLQEFLSLYKECNTQKSTLLIAGDGELKEQLEQYIKEHVLDVRLLGYKDEEDMLDLYAIADGLFLPSKSDPNPLSCIEACWCRLPLLVSEHVGNYPELVIEGVNGFVFSYQDKQSAIAKIDTFLNSKGEWYQHASEISFSKMKEMYNPENVVPRIIQETIKNF